MKKKTNKELEIIMRKYLFYGSFGAGAREFVKEMSLNKKTKNKAKKFLKDFGT